jgi:hypothetical protein
MASELSDDEQSESEPESEIAMEDMTARTNGATLENARKWNTMKGNPNKELEEMQW